MQKKLRETVGILFPQKTRYPFTPKNTASSPQPLTMPPGTCMYRWCSITLQFVHNLQIQTT
jgi:hypothetical protein